MAAWPAWILWVLGGVVSFGGLGVVLWALLWDRALGRKRCPKCWYELTVVAAAPPQCPECGYTPLRARALLRTRRRWRWALAGFLVLAAGAAAGLTPSMRGGRWHGWVPVTALIVALPWTDEPWPWDELDRRLDYSQPGVTWLKQDALRDWQWRMLARRCGVVAASGAPSSIKFRALRRVLEACPDPRPAAGDIAKCLQDSDAKVRGLTAWGIKAARYDWGDQRAPLIAALEAAPDDRARSGRSSRALALEALRGVADVPALPAALTPEEVTRLLNGAPAATLSEVHRALGAFSRMLTWAYDGDSGPLEAGAFDLEIDGQPGRDCVVRVGDRGGTHWEMLIFLQRGGTWSFAGCIGIGNQTVRAPALRAERASDGRSWLVVRACMGADGNGVSYALFGDTWLSVAPGRIKACLATPVQGYHLRPGRIAQAAPAWTLDSDPAQLVDSSEGLILEYGARVNVTMVWPDQSKGVNRTGPLIAETEAFSRAVAVRFKWNRSRELFEPIPGLGAWERASGLIDTLLGGPDEFLNTAAPDLMPIARDGSTDQRAWLRLFLNQTAPSAEREELLRALGPGEPAP